MKERLDIYLYTYLEINRADFIGASMCFYEIETTNLKYSYTNSSGEIPYPNPVIVDAYGRFPKIYIDRPYSVTINNTKGMEIFHDDYEQLDFN